MVAQTCTSLVLPYPDPYPCPVVYVTHHRLPRSVTHACLEGSGARVSQAFAATQYAADSQAASAEDRSASVIARLRDWGIRVAGGVLLTYLALRDRYSITSGKSIGGRYSEIEEGGTRSGYSSGTLHRQ